MHILVAITPVSSGLDNDNLIILWSTESHASSKYHPSCRVHFYRLHPDHAMSHLAQLLNACHFIAKDHDTEVNLSRCDDEPLQFVLFFLVVRYGCLTRKQIYNRALDNLPSLPSSKINLPP